MTIFDRLKQGWNAFRSEQENPASFSFTEVGASSYGGRPDRVRLHVSNERSIISSIYTRIAVDVSEVEIKHVRTDVNGDYLEDINSGLNSCLNIEANIDQAGRQFRQDIAMTLFDKGVIAIVPVDTSSNPNITGSYDIRSLRVGEIVNWYPKHVRVNLYNEALGRREDITLPKANVAIVENPLYSVMNEPNSTLQRLIRKLNILDSIDEQSGSGKLDLIIQLPYVIKSDIRREQAEQRRKDIEFQLKGSKYGIAYTDGTEKITQLNRPAENNLLKQIEYLTVQLYGQLGLTEAVMTGSADEGAMLSYNNRTIEPVMDAIIQAMIRSFITKTGRSQGQSMMYFKDPFRLVPLGHIAEIADKLTRNEILSANEFRQILGIRPSGDPKADQLRNSNMPQSQLGIAESNGQPAAPAIAPGKSEEAKLFDSSMADINKELDGVFKLLGETG